MDAPGSILIIKTSSLGDIVCALPVLSQLRQLYADAYIAWVVDSRFRGLLEADERIDELVVFERHKSRHWADLASALAFAAEVRRLGRVLQRRAWDVALDLQGVLKSSLILRASGAKVRIAEYDRLRHLASKWAATHLVRPTARHAVTRYLEIAASLGVRPEPVHFGLRPDPRAREWAASRLKQLPRPRLAVNVGTARQEKKWPAANFAAALAEVRECFPSLSVVATGAGGERADAERALSSCAPPAVNLAGETNLQQLVAVLEACDLLLTVDSGPMHIMAALGRPVVAIFGPTDPARNGPWGREHTVLQAPSRRTADVPPSQVAQALAAMLKPICGGE